MDSFANSFTPQSPAYSTTSPSYSPSSPTGSFGGTMTFTSTHSGSGKCHQYIDLMNGGIQCKCFSFRSTQNNNYLCGCCGHDQNYHEPIEPIPSRGFDLGSFEFDVDEMINHQNNYPRISRKNNDFKIINLMQVEGPNPKIPRGYNIYIYCLLFIISLLNKICILPLLFL
jgi:hypothetical protein